MIRLIVVTCLLVTTAGCGGEAELPQPSVDDSLAMVPNDIADHAGAYALLVGINSYEPPAARGESGRWRNLKGTANDVAAISTLLRMRYGLPEGRIRTLQDQDATRESILGAIREQLLANAAPGVELFFYYSGHGSQVQRTVQGRSEWVQTLVPSDSWAGTPDIADLELRRVFNDVLDRGARLTIVIDSCHSGGVTRSGAVSKSLPPGDLIPELPVQPGPLLSSRGAVQVLAALAEEPAQEIELAPGEYAGAFTHLLIAELMRAGPEVALAEVIERVGASLRAQRINQTPLLLADTDEQPPFLGSRMSGESAATSVRILQSENEDEPGWRVVGGLDIGLYPGSLLELESAKEITFKVVRSVGLTESIANPLDEQSDFDQSAPQWARVTRFAPSPLPPLLVFIPDVLANPKAGWFGELWMWTQAREDVTLVEVPEVAEVALRECRNEAGESGMHWVFPSRRGMIGHLTLDGMPCRNDRNEMGLLAELQSDLRKVLRAVSIEALAVASELADFPYRLETERNATMGSDATYELALRAMVPEELQSSLAIAGGGRYFNLWALDESLEIHRICPDPRSTGCAQERVPAGGWRDAPLEITLASLRLPKDERAVIFGLASTERLWRGLFGIEPMRAGRAINSHLSPHEDLFERSPAMRGGRLSWGFNMHVIEPTHGEDRD